MQHLGELLLAITQQQLVLQARLDEQEAQHNKLTTLCNRHHTDTDLAKAIALLKSNSPNDLDTMAADIQQHIEYAGGHLSGRHTQTHLPAILKHLTNQGHYSTCQIKITTAITYTATVAKKTQRFTSATPAMSFFPPNTFKPPVVAAKITWRGIDTASKRSTTRSKSAADTHDHQAHTTCLFEIASISAITLKKSNAPSLGKSVNTIASSGRGSPGSGSSINRRPKCLAIFSPDSWFFPLPWGP